MAGYGAPQRTQQVIQARENARREDHADGMREHSAEAQAYQDLNKEAPLTTQFANVDIDTMRSMVSHVNADGVEQVGHHWAKVHVHLMGAGGVGEGDCAYGSLYRAVKNVLEHWEGESADQFSAQADNILRQIANTASHASTVSQAVVHTSGTIRTQKAALDSIEKPGFFASAWDSITDSGRNDEFTEQEIRNRSLPPDVLAKVDESYLSAGKEADLNAAAVMENLARSYVMTKQHIKSGTHYNDNHDIPPSNPTMPMPTPIPPFSGSTATPSTGSPSLKPGNLSTGKKPPEPKLSRDVGVHGGEQLPLTKTKIDGLQQGITGPSGPDTLPNGSPTPRGGTQGPAHTGTPHIPGVPQGRLPNGGPGGRTPGRGPGGHPTVRGGIGSTEHSTTGGRSGNMRGMHGMGGGGGGGGKGGAAGGRGPLARAKGGVAGAPKGITGGKGPATPGGTGLGRGRGGASGAGGRGGRGMFAGGMRGSNQRPGEEENEEGSRPDYLVEDEETWTPEDGRSVPRNIE